MYNVIINNYDKFKRGSLKVESVALETTDSEKADWPDMEKIENQKELLGTYDKNLLFSSKVLEAFREHDIRPLPDVDHEPRNIWFILKDFKHKVTKTGKDYVSLKVTDVDDKARTLNYFGDEAIDLKRRCIYVGTLQMKNGWLNTVFGTKVVRIS
jgi:DNA polymerase III alpha subunit